MINFLLWHFLSADVWRAAVWRSSAGLETLHKKQANTILQIQKDFCKHFETGNVLVFLIKIIFGITFSNYSIQLTETD